MDKTKLKSDLGVVSPSVKRFVEKEKAAIAKEKEIDADLAEQKIRVSKKLEKDAEKIEKKELNIFDEIEKKIEENRKKDRKKDVNDGLNVSDKINLKKQKKIEKRAESAALGSKMDVSSGAIDERLSSGSLVRPGRYLRKKKAFLAGSVRMSFRLDRDTKDILMRLSEDTGVSMSQILNRSFWCYLALRNQIV